MNKQLEELRARDERVALRRDNAALRAEVERLGSFVEQDALRAEVARLRTALAVAADALKHIADNRRLAPDRPIHSDYIYDAARAALAGSGGGMNPNTPTHSEVDCWPLWKCVDYLQHSQLDFDAADLNSCRAAIHADITENEKP